MEQKLYASKEGASKGKPPGHANAASMARQEHPDCAQQFGSPKGLREVLTTATYMKSMCCLVPWSAGWKTRSAVQLVADLACSGACVSASAASSKFPRSPQKRYVGDSEIQHHASSR
jgi:hypothetical protein